MASSGQVSAAERVALLDVARGVAILGILFMNMPTMADYSTLGVRDPRLLGWTRADQWAYGANFLIDGTLRGILQILFGAGMMLALRRSLAPEGPVGPLDAYMRRNLWLAVFGIIHAVVFMWPGDILFIYGLAALVIPSFRRLPPRRQFRLGVRVAIGAVLVSTAYGALPQLGLAIKVAVARQQSGRSLEPAKAHPAALQEVDRNLQGHVRPPTERKATAMALERREHRGSLLDYAAFNIRMWAKYLFVDGWLLLGMVEAFAGMMIGAALYSWGILTGQRSSQFYRRLLIGCYGLGFAVRLANLDHFVDFTPMPQGLAALVLLAANQLIRLVISVGHLAALALLIRSRFAVIVRPFAANGRLPLTTYFGASLVIHDLLMPGYAGDQWGRHGFAMQMAIAATFMVIQCLGANLWLRAGFATGPIEWVWKSLAYAKRQPWRGAPDKSLQAA